MLLNLINISQLLPSVTNSGYISLGFITLQHFFVPAIYVSAFLHFNMKTIGDDKSIVNNYRDLF
jgi:hypothetical protein